MSLGETIIYYGLGELYLLGSSMCMTSLVAQTVKRLPTMQETWVWSLGWEDPLEKAMATHSSTLAWKIPWTEEPGRLQSMGSQRVRHDWATSLSLSLIAPSWMCKEPALLSSFRITLQSHSNLEIPLVAQMVKHLPAMRKTWVQSQGWEDPLEKAMATHSSTLAWKIPWAEEPDRLQSMGSQRVGHDWMTSLSLSLSLYVCS